MARFRMISFCVQFESASRDALVSSRPTEKAKACSVINQQIGRQGYNRCATVTGALSGVIGKECGPGGAKPTEHRGATSQLEAHGVCRSGRIPDRLRLDIGETAISMILGEVDATAASVLVTKSSDPTLIGGSRQLACSGKPGSG
jgi:hypothetical protein